MPDQRRSVGTPPQRVHHLVERAREELIDEDHDEHADERLRRPRPPRHGLLGQSLPLHSPLDNGRALWQRPNAAVQLLDHPLWTDRFLEGEEIVDHQVAPTL